MEVLLYVAAGLAGGLAYAGVLAYRRRPKPRREVVVNTKDDRTLQGVQLDDEGPYLVLANARWLNEAQTEDIPGTVRVPKANESFTQLLSS